MRVPASENPVKNVARSVRLMDVFRSERPDRIVSFMEGANFPAIAAAAATGFLDRLRVSVHIDPSMMGAKYRALIPWLYRVPERVITPSQGVKKALEGMGVPGKKVAAIPNPVVTPGIAEPTSRSPFPRRFIMGAGRLHIAKGFDRLLNAFSSIHRRDLDLVILGERDEHAVLVALAQDLGIETRVHFPGAVSDIETWYRDAECFVLSSRYDGWANVLVEAMPNGCPVVSFDCRYGPSEIVEDGKDGLLVDEGNIGALTVANEIRAAMVGVLHPVIVQTLWANYRAERIKKLYHVQSS